VVSGKIIALGIAPNKRAETFDEKRAESVLAFDGQEAIIFLADGDRRFNSYRFKVSTTEAELEGLLPII
jgi:hypothetical protein